MSLWEEVKKNVVELYTVTSDKTTEITKVSSRSWDKFGISRDIERQFGELGNLVYTGLKEGREDLLQDPALEVLMARIEALENELKTKEDEIEGIKEEHRQRRAAQRQAAAEAERAAAEAARAAAAARAAGPDLDPAEEAMAGEAGDGFEDGDEDAPQVLITDPVLDRGHSDSAILVEPGADEDEEDDSIEVEMVALEDEGEALDPATDETGDEDQEKPRN